MYLNSPINKKYSANFTMHILHFYTNMMQIKAVYLVGSLFFSCFQILSMGV